MVSDKKQRAQAVRDQEHQMIKQASEIAPSDTYDFLKAEYMKDTFPPTTNQEFIN